MASYSRYLPEYLRRVLWRVDALLGVVVGVVLVVVDLALSLEGSVVLKTGLAVLGFVFLEAGYGVFREERATRAEREKQVRLVARPDSLAINMRRPAPDEVDIQAHISFEVWTDKDIHTSGLVLNLLEVQQRPWWKVWQIGQTRTKRLLGLRPVDQDTALYRKTIRAVQPQPYEGSVEFDWRGKLVWRGEPILELVLITGQPEGELRAVVDPRLGERGSTAPV